MNRNLLLFELRKLETRIEHLVMEYKGIVEIALEDEYEESDYEEISHMMKSSPISLDDLQGEEFIPCCIL